MSDQPEINIGNMQLNTSVSDSQHTGTSADQAASQQEQGMGMDASCDCFESYELRKRY